MNTERIRAAGLAVVVVVAVGLSASTLASSMSTDPAEAVDIQWDALPLGEDSETDVVAAAQGIEDTYTNGGEDDDGSGGPQRGAGDASRERAGERPGDSEFRDEQASDGDAQAAQGRDGEERGGAADESGDDSAADDDGADPTGSDGLVAGVWPRYLLVLLGLLVVAVALAYRYRDRLRRAIGGQPEPAERSISPAPANEVERAWVELVRRAGVDRPRTRTPRDCARRAVETGFDPGQVERLRRTFEDVRYGTAPVTDEQARLARETLARLDGERA